MHTKKWFSVIAAVFLFVQPVLAYEVGIIAGIRQTDVELDTSDADTSSGTGLQAGVLGLMEVGNGWNVRAGGIYSTRSFDVKVGDLKDEVTLTYLDVPLTVMYLVNETFGFFGGLNLGLQVGDDCDQSGSGSGNCDYGDDATGVIYSLQLGGQFRFVPNMGLELTYDLGMSDVWEGDDVTLEKASGVAANFLYLF